MVHGAVYDAVNAIDGGHEGYLLSSRVATPSDSMDAAAATAAYRVLVHLVPAQQATLDAQYAASLAAIPDGSSKTRGIAVGEAAAAAMIAARTDDGRFGPFRFAVGSGPGVWRPVLPAFVNDPNAWLKDVKPFLIRSPSQFRSKGPLELDQPEVRTRVRRGQVARLGDEYNADGRSGAGRTLLGGEPARDVEPDLPDALGTGGTVPRGERALLRDALPDGGRLPHQRLGRQGALVILAADHGDPGGRTPTGTRERSRTAGGCR